MDWKALTSRAAPVVVNVRVEMAYGENGEPRTLDIPLNTLSYGEWMGVEAEVPEPAVPRTLAGVGGVKLPNKDDIAYRAALSAANEERAYRRLALALEKGGMVIPGASAKEKAAAIKDELDAGVSNALLTFLATAAMGGKATAESAADTFRG
jgi:hypothetical protein